MIDKDESPEGFLDPVIKPIERYTGYFSLMLSRTVSLRYDMFVCRSKEEIPYFELGAIYIEE